MGYNLLCMETRQITKGSTRPNTSLAPLLRAFKEQICDENVLIGEVLRTTLKRHLRGPVLDVGAGLGDIALASFADVPAILLDTEPWSAPTSPLHRREIGDFFDYVEANSSTVGTLLLCHVLQYIDDDEPRLKRAVARLNAKSVITVLNDNTSSFGDLMNWANSHVVGANPERPIAPVDTRVYKVVAVEPVAATMICPSFEVMAQHFVSVLLDTDEGGESMRAMADKLRSALSAPAIVINQTVTCYERRS